MDNVFIPKPERLDSLKKSISEDGVSKLYILTDFDRTLTKAFIDRKNIPSLISILRDGNYLTPDYAEKAHALYDKYHPIEIDLKIPLEKRKEAMHEWWTTHSSLLINSGLNKKDLRNIINSKKIRFREGALEFLDFLNEHRIPLLIISSSGLGRDPISMFFKRENRLYDNIHIISNSYEWDGNGNATGFNEPIIHALNKEEINIRNYLVFEELKDRKNIILLGDNIEDINMVKSFSHDNLIKIGFLNENIEENLKLYLFNYDIVITNDSSMDYINELLRSIFSLVKEK